MTTSPSDGHPETSAAGLLPQAFELVDRMRTILYADASEEEVSRRVRELHVGNIEVEMEAFSQLTATERRAWHTYFTRAFEASL